MRWLTPRRSATEGRSSSGCVTADVLAGHGGVLLGWAQERTPRLVTRVNGSTPLVSAAIAPGATTGTTGFTLPSPTWSTRPSSSGWCRPPGRLGNRHRLGAGHPISGSLRRLTRSRLGDGWLAHRALPLVLLTTDASAPERAGAEALSVLEGPEPAGLRPGRAARPLCPGAAA